MQPAGYGTAVYKIQGTKPTDFLPSLLVLDCRLVRSFSFASLFSWESCSTGRVKGLPALFVVLF